MAPILIVDDESEIRATLRLLLEDNGYLVAEAAHGEAAIDYLRRATQPHIVLLDLMMPRLDGAGVLQIIQREPALQQHAIVLMTARQRTLPLEVAKIVGIGHLTMLPKPFDIDVVLNIIRALEARQNVRR